MCLVFFSVKQHPDYPLIVVANRDEFYNRSTKSAGYWPASPQVLGGLDLQANGTWLGITTEGKIGWLTNFRDPKNISPQATSRGLLVSDYLTSSQKALKYLKMIERKENTYNPFNLIVGTIEELYYFSNYKKGIEKIAPGLYGLSNAFLDTPWPKVKLGKEKLSAILKKEKFDTEELFELLSDNSSPPDYQLPDTGIGLELERALSSMFVKTQNYGTRCSTIIMADNNNRIFFSERVYDPQSTDFITNTFEQEVYLGQALK